MLTKPTTNITFIYFFLIDILHASKIVKILCQKYALSKHFTIDLVSMTIVMLHSKLHTQKILNLYDKINQVCTGKTFILCNFNYKRMLHGSSSCGAKIHTKCIKYITLKFKKLFQIVNKIKIQIEFKNY